MSRNQAVPVHLRAVVAVVVLLVVTSLAPAAATSRPRALPIEVATYNLYLGADLTPLFGAASVEDLLTTAPAVWAEVGASLPAERMAAVARVVARERPEIVGLQEVALWETAPYAFVQPPGAPQPIPQATAAYQPVHDLLSLLLGALAERGTPYEAVAVNQNFTSADLGFAVPVSETEAVQFTDRDVILVRADARRHLAITGTDGGTFDARFRAQVLGIPLEVDRGWVSVDVSLRGRPFRLFNTHLEAYGTSLLRDEVRNLQAVELAARVTASPHPTVVVGDINARPTMCQSWRQPPQPEDANVVAYATLAEAGLREVWPLTHRHRPCSPAGWTSGQADLFGPDTRTHRIDHIFIDDSFWALRSTVVGDEQRERSRPSGAWPSDHAAAVADLVLLATPARGSDPR